MCQSVLPQAADRWKLKQHGRERQGKGGRGHSAAAQRTQEPGWQPNPADPEASLETGRRQERSNGTPPSLDNKAAEEM